MTLDPRTVIFCVVLTNTLLWGMLAFYQSHQKTYAGFGYWTVSMLGIAVGLVALVARWFGMPLWLSVLLFGVLFPLAYLLRLEGTVRFVEGHSVDRRWYLVPVATGGINLALVQGPEVARSLVLTVALAIPAAATACVFLRNTTPRNRRLFWAVAGVQFSFLFLVVPRGVLWLFHPEAGSVLSIWLASGFTLVNGLLEVVVAFSFVIINAQRLEDELVESREQHHQALENLQETMSQLKVLRGLVPICATCKNVRDENGDWRTIEQYVRQRSQADFSHGICPECLQRLYPDLAAEVLRQSSQG